ncbi:DUF378 domain-containing protein [Candidatus Pacearchaeota archaeon]|nr:DUF378 domain-containing protein [Candidatus Pacearchaeota archaeon]
MGALEAIAKILLIVGGLNWALFAFNWNLVDKIFGVGIIAKIIYILVGLSAVWLLFNFSKK